ncbi:MerR family transcriptional regulator [Ornithinibacillus halophilus]|uniref:MerR family transcriptional regulator, Zn(II)-responsive regulator of zntA n=2 Tax=Ornithinibacillus halophilus TaxID=930117 RepID=A0A1M5JA25_9BACI|nr:MerR family transcriptional regulator [Ornithinibacillus halophilus]SHG37225.1 MerR family transcriptional regulator, Zn(II)-responsive regulator of zntA [Ornithinibacillus halophilus]
MEKLYSIQEVSQKLGISKDTLRYYDRIGILSPTRDDNMYRKYSRNDLITLMNIQIMQYADFSLEEIKEKLIGIYKMETIDFAYCEDVASFLDAKNAEIRKKITHLEKVSQLLDMAAETLRDFNKESDRRLAEFVLELYKDIRENEPEIAEEGCDYN